MDFAKKQLEKYGWTEGKGLGKNENGISAPLRPKLKFDNFGFGHKVGDDFTNNWWTNIYNNALNNIEVKNKDDGRIEMSLKTCTSLTAKSEVTKQMKELPYYNSFLHTSKLIENKVIDTCSESVYVPEYSSTLKLAAVIDDEQLFSACDRRTAHKGARHGIKLSGKLSRLEKQEKMLLKKFQNVSIYDDKKEIKKKIEKISKHKEKHMYVDVEERFNTLVFEDDSRSSTSSTSKKKRKKKDRKSVSFSETVTEYHTQDLDSSINSNDGSVASVTVVERSRIKDEDPPSDIKCDHNVLDEGIEQDIEGRSVEDCDNKSFEEAQYNIRKILSKTESKLKKKNRVTLRIMPEIDTLEVGFNLNHNLHESCKKCKKRKHLDVEELESSAESKRHCEHRETRKKKNKKNKKRQHKQRKREEKKINSITKSLYHVCKIADTE